MDSKISRIKKAADETDYLRGEYEGVKLWGNCPGGDVKFETFMAWLDENEHIVSHMIQINKLIKEI